MHHLISSWGFLSAFFWNLKLRSSCDGVRQWDLRYSPVAILYMTRACGLVFVLALGPVLLHHIMSYRNLQKCCFISSSSWDSFTSCGIFFFKYLDEPLFHSGDCNLWSCEHAQRIWKGQRWGARWRWRLFHESRSRMGGKSLVSLNKVKSFYTTGSSFFFFF